MPTVPALLERFRVPTGSLPTMTERAVAAVAGIVPGVPSPTPYGGLAELVAAEELARVEAAVASVTADRMVRLGLALDTVDRVVPMDLDQQAADAALKLLALAALGVQGLRLRGDQGVGEAAVLLLRERPAGRQGLGWWAAVEVVLPLGGADVAGLLVRHGDAQLLRLARLAGEEVAEGVSTTLGPLAEVAARVVDAAQRRAEALPAAVAPFVPGLIVEGPRADERVASGADALPVWSWIAHRLALEQALP